MARKQIATQVHEPKTPYKSSVLEAAHEIASDLHSAGFLDERTMRRFDEACLTPVRSEITADELKALRARERASQAVFAKHLNVAVSTVSQWERGERKPEGPALKLLELVQVHGLDYIR